MYYLCINEKNRYAKQYPQVAPEVRQGIALQSYESDMYSFGRILLHVNNEKLKLPVLERMSNECLSARLKLRPKAKDLKIFVHNLK